ncbi:hypothetical protein BT96DRAFT_1039435 [Gymnopus androsaceus JB14]|uniref:DUF6532 domain-containing protein n=1 Tax=Gymnopus androsaceus JB14 TaxID=1447944 RepID=A0A6A4HFM7_9AGAR|nr:hypothetical protein BT96DRAFT_1039435 [Gymnopus androsaceus JB14]
MIFERFSAHLPDLGVRINTCRHLFPTSDTSTLDWEKENESLAISTGKRSHDQAELMDDNGERRKAGYRVSDLSSDRRRIVEEAYPRFRLGFLGTNAWLGGVDAEVLATVCWYGAVDKLIERKIFTSVIHPMRVPPTRGELSLITDRIWQHRGRARDEARHLVKEGFDPQHKLLEATALETSGEELAREDANCSLYELLMAGDAFVNRNPFDSADTQGALYRAPWIQRLCNNLWFSKKSKSEGLAFPSNKVPLPALALAITAYEIALDEWKSGYFAAIRFDEANGYNDRYQLHLSTIEEWNVYSSASGRGKECKALQCELYEAGVKYTKIPKKSAIQKSSSSFNVASFAANESQ